LDGVVILPEQSLFIEIKNKIRIITDLLSDLQRILFKPISNQEVWLKQLNNSIKFIEWTISKYKLQFNGIPKHIYKKDIFYCKLGFNIGSEQCGERPVVILQNSVNSTVTIVAPITTINGVIEKAEEGHYIIRNIDKDGNEKIKKLDMDIEIPIEIEKGYRKKITGYVDIGQIRTVSKKRLDKIPVAKITNGTTQLIKNGIKKLLDIA